MTRARARSIAVKSSAPTTSTSFRSSPRATVWSTRLRAAGKWPAPSSTRPDCRGHSERRGRPQQQQQQQLRSGWPGRRLHSPSQCQRRRCRYPKKIGQWFDTSKFSSVTPQWLGGPNLGFGTCRQGRDRGTWTRELHHVALQVVRDHRAGALRAAVRIVQHLQPHGTERSDHQLQPAEQIPVQHHTARGNSSARSPARGIRVTSSWAASSCSKPTTPTMGAAAMLPRPFSFRQACFVTREGPGRWQIDRSHCTARLRTLPEALVLAMTQQHNAGWNQCGRANAVGRNGIRRGNGARNVNATNLTHDFPSPA